MDVERDEQELREAKRLLARNISDDESLRHIEELFRFLPAAATQGDQSLSQDGLARRGIFVLVP
jgi:hypothetical protein